MFAGQNEIAVDKKGRISVPFRYRRLMKEHNLGYFHVSEEEPDGYRFLSLYPGQEGTEIKNNGRISLPRVALDFAGIENKAVAVGNNNHIELWSPEEWERFLRENKKTEYNVALFMETTAAL